MDTYVYPNTRIFISLHILLIGAGLGDEGGSKVHNSTWIRLLFPSILVVGVAVRDVLEGGEGRREWIHCRF